uniref:Uncharacterized protein n=1 Tax=Arundo donax TaxID=35708 RepID=A0A0A9B827_ARUDO
MNKVEVLCCGKVGLHGKEQ